MLRDKLMRKSLLIILCLTLMVSLLPAAALCETVHSYDFDFHFHLESSAFAEEARQRIQGYADLLEILEVKGSWTYCDETRSVDTAFSVIPETNPDAALSFHLYGYPSHIVLSSPLMGNQIIFFNNDALLEFCLKTYEHLGLPLYSLGLMFPYSFEHAFAGIAEAWNEAAGTSGQDRTITADALQVCAETWSDLLENDGDLNDWITAMSLRNEEQEVLRAEMYEAPAYLTEILAEGSDIRIVSDGSEELWTVGENIFLRESRQTDAYSFETSFPLTQSGFQPVFRFSRHEKEETTEASLLISYLSEEEEEEPLINLAAQLLWPSVWPAESVYDSRITLDSSLLGSLDMLLSISCQQDGSFTLCLSTPADSEMSETVRIEGILTPREIIAAPSFNIGEILTYVNIFSVNDVTLNEFVHAIARPAVTGALAFLVEVPASAMQSVMDDLTDFGVLGVVLGD